MIKNNKNILKNYKNYKKADSILFFRHLRCFYIINIEYPMQDDGMQSRVIFNQKIGKKRTIDMHPEMLITLYKVDNFF